MRTDKSVVSADSARGSCHAHYTDMPFLAGGKPERLDIQRLLICLALPSRARQFPGCP